MAGDIFDELLGPAGAPPEQLISALRRQRTLGQVGALSGDKSIARLGSSEYDDSVKQAQDIRDQRYRTSRASAEDAYRKQQQDASAAESVANNDYRNRALKQARELAEAQNRNALEAAGLRTATTGAAAKKAHDQQLNKLEAALRTSGIGNIWSAMQDAKGVVDEYTTKDPKGNVVGFQGVPGVGGLANVRNLGIGTGVNLLDAKGRDNQSKIAALQNLVLQARSGAAVTDPELNRMLAETGLTMFSSDQDFLRAFPRLLQKAEESVRNTTAGYDPEVVDEYVRRGGLKGFSTGRPRNKDADIEGLLYGEDQ